MLVSFISHELTMMKFFTISANLVLAHPASLLGRTSQDTRLIMIPCTITTILPTPPLQNEPPCPISLGTITASSRELSPSERCQKINLFSPTQRPTRPMTINIRNRLRRAIMATPRSALCILSILTINKTTITSKDTPITIK